MKSEGVRSAQGLCQRTVPEKRDALRGMGMNRGADEMAGTQGRGAIQPHLRSPVRGAQGLCQHTAPKSLTHCGACT